MVVKLTETQTDFLVDSILGSCSNLSDILPFFEEIFKFECPEELAHEALEDCGIYLCDSCGWWTDSVIFTEQVPCDGCYEELDCE